MEPLTLKDGYKEIENMTVGELVNQLKLGQGIPTPAAACLLSYLETYLYYKDKLPFFEKCQECIGKYYKIMNTNEVVKVLELVKDMFRIKRIDNSSDFVSIETDFVRCEYLFDRGYEIDVNEYLNELQKVERRLWE